MMSRTHGHTVNGGQGQDSNRPQTQVFLTRFVHRQACLRVASGSGQCKDVCLSHTTAGPGTRRHTGRLLSNSHRSPHLCQCRVHPVSSGLFLFV